MTIRTNRTSIFQDVSKDLSCHAARIGLSADTVHRLFDLDDVVLANALIFLGRHDDRDVTLLTANDNGFALCRIKKRGQALFCVSCGYSFHMFILSNLDRIDNCEGDRSA